LNLLSFNGTKAIMNDPDLVTALWAREPVAIQELLDTYVTEETGGRGEPVNKHKRPTIAPPALKIAVVTNYGV
jgi:hypothetical protein